MSTRNDITGDAIKSKVASQAYKDNWDRIFGKSSPVEEQEQHERRISGSSILEDPEKGQSL